MNSLAIGSLILLYILLQNAAGAYVQTQNFEPPTIPGCPAESNLTECQDVGQTSFLSAILSVSVNGIEGAPAQFNDFWLFVNVFLLIFAILLIVGWFVGLPFGGAS